MSNKKKTGISNRSRQLSKKTKKLDRSRSGIGGSRERLPALSLLSDLPLLCDLVCSEKQLAAYTALRKRLIGVDVVTGSRLVVGPGAKAGLDDGVALGAPELHLGCVVRLDRGFPAVAYEGGLVRAEFSARLGKAEKNDVGPARPLSEGETCRVAIGDWVALRVPAAHEQGVIEAVLPRESDVARWRGRARGERQTLAANVDIVFIVSALGTRKVSADRIARSAVISRDCGARVAVVLTKADRVDRSAVACDIGLVRAVLGEDVPIVVTAAVNYGKNRAKERAGAVGVAAADVRGAGRGRGSVDAGGVGAAGRGSVDAGGVGAAGRGGIDVLRALVPKGTVGIMLGESGAGKSTLLNALLGYKVLQTGHVRARDDAGRHTTVARRMVKLPGAGVIIDEPGLRSLPLVGHERGLALVFPTIANAARACRFRDCTHTHEPGCAVRELRARGAFTAEALDAYLTLAAEMRTGAAALDPDVVL